MVVILWWSNGRPHNLTKEKYGLTKDKIIDKQKIKQTMIWSQAL